MKKTFFIISLMLSILAISSVVIISFKPNGEIQDDYIVAKNSNSLFSENNQATTQKDITQGVVNEGLIHSSTHHTTTEEPLTPIEAFNQESHDTASHDLPENEDGVIDFNSVVYGEVSQDADVRANKLSNTKSNLHIQPIDPETDPANQLANSNTIKPLKPSATTTSEPSSEVELSSPYE